MSVSVCGWVCIIQQPCTRNRLSRIGWCPFAPNLYLASADCWNARIARMSMLLRDGGGDVIVCMMVVVMYVCMYVCMYAGMQGCMYAGMYVCRDGCMQGCM